MAITFDPAKRKAALEERGLNFEDAELVFAGLVHTFEDVRWNYGEVRNITAGLLGDRMVIVGWTPRGKHRHVFSMRKANDREQARYTPLLRRSPDQE